jgi:hypothetical protein
MNRTTRLQDRRIQKFRDVLSRREGGEPSMLEAGELPGALAASSRWSELFSNQSIFSIMRGNFHSLSTGKIPSISAFFERGRL